MRKCLITAIAIIFIFSALFVVNGNPEKGKALYDKKCKMCHAIDGTGSAKMAKLFKLGSTETLDLTRKEMGEKDDQAIIELMKTGKMKRITKSFKRADFTNVVAYIRILQKQTGE